VGIWLSYKAGTDSAIMSAETYTRFFNKLGLRGLFKNKRSKKHEDSSGNK